MSASGSNALNRLWPAAFAACFLAILPILSARHLPLLDAQGHESRLAVLRDILLLGHGSPFYKFTGFFLPNAAFDLLGLGLVGFAGPEVSAQVFFGVTLVLTIAGVWVLNRIVTGRWNLAPLAASLLVYNLITILGFLSYAFGFALVLWALAGWKRLRGSLPAVQATFGGAAGLILLFCHVFDFGIYAVMLGGFTATDLIARRLPWSRAAATALSLIPAAIAYGFMAQPGNGRIRFEGHLLAVKLFGLAKSVTCASLTGDLAFAAGVLLFALVLLTSPRVRLASGFALGIAGLTLLYLVLPDKLASGSYVDKRMPIAVALLLLAGLDLQVRRSHLSMALVCLVGAALVVKQGALTLLWRSFDPVIDAMAAALEVLPAGSIIMQAECEPSSGQILSVYHERQPSLTHVPAMAAFADSRFVASTWAIAGQHSIEVNAAYRAYYDLQESFGSSTCDAAGYRAEYDRISALMRGSPQIGPAPPPVFFLLIRPPAPNPLAGTAEPVSSTASFTLYNVQ